jgi:hypothetical protein
MKKAVLSILTLSLLLVGCSYLQSPAPPAPKKQKILRVWKGSNNDEWTRVACGLPKVNLQSYLDSGWKIISTQPFQHERYIPTYGNTYICVGSEIVLESKY